MEDRSGNSDPQFLTANLYKFLGALSKRPEIAAAIPTYYPAVPQLYVDVDREKVAQQQVNLGDVYTTMQAFMGGSLVNYFNRFGRQWQTYVEAEGDSRTDIDNIGQFYVTAANGNRVPLSALTTIRRTTGPEFTMRFNEYEAAQITIVAKPGYSSGQVMSGLEQTFAQTMPKGMGFDYSGMSFQEHKAQQSLPAWVVYALSILFCFLILAHIMRAGRCPSASCSARRSRSSEPTSRSLCDTSKMMSMHRSAWSCSSASRPRTPS